MYCHYEIIFNSHYLLLIIIIKYRSTKRKLMQNLVTFFFRYILKVVINILERFTVVL